MNFLLLIQLLFYLDVSHAQYYGTFCPVNSSPGFLYDPCSAEHPCFDEYSLECRNGTCQCRKGYLESTEENGLCDYAPWSQNQPCTTVCQEPLTCRESYGTTTVLYGTDDDIVTVPPDTTPFPGTTPSAVKTHPTRPPRPTHPAKGRPDTEPTDTPTPTPTPYDVDTASPVTPYVYNGKRCFCDPPYVLLDYYNCRLPCGPDEYSYYGQCISNEHCTTDEVRLPSGECVEAGELGSPCNHSVQCVQPYSDCVNGTCQCQSEFLEEDGSCVPETYSCPWGSPTLGGDGDVIHCNGSANYYSASGRWDTCPEGSYCLTSPSTDNDDDYYYYNTVKQGFCCPKLNLSCPVGKPAQNATCGYDPYVPYCPYETHYCYSISVYTYTEQLCCPKICRNGFVLVEGECYQLVRYGDRCEVDQQCRESNGICGENGTCVCPPYTQVYGSPPYQYCYGYSPYCSSDEVQFDNKCYKKLNLSDTCPDYPPVNLCPDNAGCDENNTCSCYCNHVQLGDNRCEPYPVCRRLYYYYYYYPQSYTTDGPCQASNDSDGNTTATNCPSTTTLEPFTYDDHTFCVVNGQQPPVPAAQQCEDGEYCNYYTYDLGQCCPIPDPVCSDGVQTNIICDPNTYPSTCPYGTYCYKYFSAVSGEPRSGGTCCPYDYYYI